MAILRYKNVRIVDVLVGPAEQPSVRPYSPAKEHHPAPPPDDTTISDQSASDEPAEVANEAEQETGTGESASIERPPCPDNQPKPTKDDCVDEAVAILLKSLIRAAITKPNNAPPAPHTTPRFEQAEAC